MNEIEQMKQQIKELEHVRLNGTETLGSAVILVMISGRSKEMKRRVSSSSKVCPKCHQPLLARAHNRVTKKGKPMTFVEVRCFVCNPSRSVRKRLKRC